MATRLEKLGSRRLDTSVLTAKLQNESWQSIYQTDSVKYVVGAMQPIDPEYTKNTYSQGDRVRNQLAGRLTQACDFEYQGSTTNDTHIKAASDIDLLILTKRFWTLEPPQVPPNPYKGDPIQDLRQLRSEAISSLKTAFPQAKVDTSGDISVSISGGSLTRKVDVVPANWFDTVSYATNQKKMYRGVQVLSASTGVRITNTPFLHNAWIDYVDGETGGGLRKAARLLKSLKYDSGSIDLASYDIVSLAFNIPKDNLNFPRGQELSILGACLEFVGAILQNVELRVGLNVPDGHRKIFATGHATLKGLTQLGAELETLATDVLKENKRSFQKLAEARVEY